uniref:MARVEL domain-containing protein n=1 Tax=Monodelphis domestica TaxID=13616 RepID=A0A5F8G7I7_MONDO
MTWGLQINFSPLKEPLGFIKVLQWVASIFSFVTCGGFKGKTELTVNCLNENHTIDADFAYPLRLNRSSSLSCDLEG